MYFLELMKQCSTEQIAASHVLVDRLSIDDACNLACGESITVGDAGGSILIDPIMHDHTSLNPFEDALMERVASSTELHQLLKQSQNGPLYASEKSDDQATTAKKVFFQKRLGMILDGANVIKSGYDQNIFLPSLDNKIQTFRDFCLQWGLLDNGIVTGNSSVDLIPFIGKEWKTIKKFRTETLPPQIMQRYSFIENNLNLSLYIEPQSEKIFRNFFEKNRKIKKINLRIFFSDGVRHFHSIMLCDEDKRNNLEKITGVQLSLASSLNITNLYRTEELTQMEVTLQSLKQKILFLNAAYSEGKHETQKKALFEGISRLRKINKIILNPCSTRWHFLSIILNTLNLLNVPEIQAVLSLYQGESQLLIKDQKTQTVIHQRNLQQKTLQQSDFDRLGNRLNENDLDEFKNDFKQLSV